MLRSYCSTNEVRSSAEKLIREGFAPLAFTPAGFLCFFLFTAEKKEGKHENDMHLFLPASLPRDLLCFLRLFPSLRSFAIRRVFFFFNFLLALIRRLSRTTSW